MSRRPPSVSRQGLILRETFQKRRPSPPPEIVAKQGVFVQCPLPQRSTGFQVRTNQADRQREGDGPLEASGRVSRFSIIC